MERRRNRVGALLALIGGAVGLGNFLRFPFQAAKWGGGAFLIPYAVALIVVGLPLVWMEIALGRQGSHAGQSAPRILSSLSGRMGWFIGLLGVYVSMGVGAYYAYLTGWTLGYAYHGAIGSFDAQDLGFCVAFHKRFLEGESYLFLGITWLLLAGVLHRGLHSGVERISLWGMPILFALAIVIAGGVVFLGDTGRCSSCDSWVGIRYLYMPRWDALTKPAVWLAATGQVFFSVGVGFAMYPVYAASWEGGDVLQRGALTVAANTVAEVVLGGLIGIPLVTAFMGIEAVSARAGFGMGFEVMPYVLTQWGGRALVVAWYVLLFLAAFTSLLAMGWVALTWLVDTVGGAHTRWVWPLILGMALLGMPPAFGYGQGALDLYDQWVGSIFLVLAALGYWWIFHRVNGWEVLERESRWRLGAFWRVSMRWGTPLFLGSLLVGSFFQPVEGDWVAAFRELLDSGKWPWSADALPVWIGRSLSKGMWAQLGFLFLLLSGGGLVLLRRSERT
ncbi:MAG: sodium-dependent transporter [Bacteroidia bacterium]|nr:sodium-dependent transporter [Bacteroidia bacterium]